jgi:hypothetical protein
MENGNNLPQLGISPFPGEPAPAAAVPNRRYNPKPGQWSIEQAHNMFVEMRALIVERDFVEEGATHRDQIAAMLTAALIGKK